MTRETTPRKRGRPTRWDGVKYRPTVREGWDREMVPVFEFCRLWDSLPKKRGRDRYIEALSTIAQQHGISPRTLERRYAEFRGAVEPWRDIWKMPAFLALSTAFDQFREPVTPTKKK